MRVAGDAISVLVVDDERPNLDLLGSVLAKAGYRNVALVADGAITVGP